MVLVIMVLNFDRLLVDRYLLSDWMLVVSFLVIWF